MGRRSGNFIERGSANAERGTAMRGRSRRRRSALCSAFRVPPWGGGVIDLSGKRAFVTGGARGIGRATAVLLARAGCAVAVGYRRRRQDAEATVSAVEGGQGRSQAVAIAGDQGDPAAARRAVNERSVERRVGKEGRSRVGRDREERR